MSNKVMIDSSVLIEFAKGAKKNLLLSLTENQEYACCINETVVSEFLYYFLILNSGASPMSLKSSGKISQVFAASEDYRLLQSFLFLPTDNSLFSRVPHLMSTYNLLPNDAIIIATCNIHGI